MLFLNGLESTLTSFVKDVLNLLQHLQEIQIVTQDINQQFKNIQEEMLVTASLINVIESKTQGN